MLKRGRRHYQNCYEILGKLCSHWVSTINKKYYDSTTIKYCLVTEIGFFACVCRSPNGDGLVHWPQYGEEENYLLIDTEQVVRQQLNKEHFVFLTQTLPKIIGTLFMFILLSFHFLCYICAH